MKTPTSFDPDSLLRVSKTCTNIDMTGEIQPRKTAEVSFGEPGGKFPWARLEGFIGYQVGNMAYQLQLQQSSHDQSDKDLYHIVRHSTRSTALAASLATTVAQLRNNY